ncbi:MAG: class II aldolase/adducin family protein, partial [Desulfofustis sp.]|nr:class II aldolase/adducin family protein [Desulfofustis sp.]
MDKQMKEAILEANLMLKELGLVIFTWGNVSGIDRKTGEVTIKPSGVPYDTMKVEDLVTVDMEGKVLEGSYNPSSDLA